ncbi:MAG: hypothetical protein A2381_03615 [Bdellovibrionales bacterium RIFOXYB1_FULL_37_110]|nr:MAG: hypothetical protein A2417_16210 [Bdellovibrionales bacterium RIFOXYC1_FULL_37_79]OFZ59125.1 MAG: hypothetical protein A2381_03615 [Bdellovibrionales bacterium RIFOXYB1_FULL_37_110]OFZ64130.1 MAG: hypothetical protein A2577_14645 [Bdellovibrionales bacterium RIFOXYD1_FULL_36_51]
MKMIYVLVYTFACMISFYASAEHECKINMWEKVKCNGDNSYGQCDVPELKKPEWVMVGKNHTCALDKNGVKCWGDNQYGQTIVPALKNPRSIIIDDDYACIIDDTGVKCWGDNRYGQTSVPSLRKIVRLFKGPVGPCVEDVSEIGVKREVCWGNNVEVRLLSLNESQFKPIAQMENYRCGIYDGYVECWGRLKENILYVINGKPEMIAVSSRDSFFTLDKGEIKCWGDTYCQKTRLPPLRKVRKISSRLDDYSGYRFTIFVEDESSVGVKRKVCWGYERDEVEILSPSLDQFTDIAYGYGFGCGFYKNSLECWGKNEYGGASAPLLQNPSQVIVGRYHACAIDDNGVKCWGDNNYAQNNVPSLKNPRQIATSDENTCAIDDDGVKCWGDNNYGQNNVPALKNPRQIATFDKNVCAIDDDGVKCWGNNESGQNNVPPLKNPKQVDIGYLHVCALGDNGVKCWGGNGDGQTNVPPLRKVLEISVDGYVTCALDESPTRVKRKVCWGYKRDEVKILSPSLDQFTNIIDGTKYQCGFYKGSVECWGHNEQGQANVPLLKNPRQVVMGFSHTCALDDDGVKCWGNNRHGEINVPPLRNVNKLYVDGWYTSCAEDQSLLGIKRSVCWGQRRQIKILQPNVDQFTDIKYAYGSNFKCGLYKNFLECWGDPGFEVTQISPFKNPKQVVVGKHHVCVLEDEGVQCWEESSWPAVVPPLRNPHQIAAGEFHTCALDDDGVKCWGNNSDGQGDVPYLEKPRQIVSGGNYTCAIDDDGVKCWGKDAKLFDLNNTYGDLLVVGTKDGIVKISKEDNAGVTNLSQAFFMFYPYIFKNELRFFYSFDKLFGEKLFKILLPGSKYSKLMALFHSELKKEMGLIDSDEKYRFLWNKEIYLPYGHEFLTEPSAPENDEERKQLLNALVESIKTTMPLMSDEYKQRASGIILKLVSSMSAVTLDETAAFVSDAGLNPYISPRVKLQMELIRLLGL